MVHADKNKMITVMGSRYILQMETYEKYLGSLT